MHTKEVRKMNINDIGKTPPINPNIEVAPIVHTTPSGESVFKGVETTHFSHVPGKGFHVTTDIPGVPRGSSDHMDIPTK